MEETIEIKKIDYDLLVGQNKELLQQNLDLQSELIAAKELLIKETNCSSKVLKAYCALIEDMLKNQNELAAYFKNDKEAKNE